MSGEDFLAVFRDLECEEFFLVPPGAPPTVRVEGNVVTVAADRVDVLDCSSPAETYSIGISGLPAGDYTLRLAARYLGDGTEFIEETTQFTVGYGTVAVPAFGDGALLGLAVLAAVVGLRRLSDR